MKHLLFRIQGNGFIRVAMQNSNQNRLNRVILFCKNGM